MIIRNLRQISNFKLKNLLKLRLGYDWYVRPTTLSNEPAAATNSIAVTDIIEYNNEYFIISTSGLFKTQGKSTTNLVKLSTIRFRDVSINGDGIIYGILTNSATVRSTNGGNSFQTFNVGIGDQAAYRLETYNNTILYGFNLGYIGYSTDYGLSFQQQTNTPFINNTNKIITAIACNNGIWVAGGGGSSGNVMNLARSYDGINWHTISTPLLQRQVERIFNVNNVWYVTFGISGGNRLHRSTDNGDTWQQAIIANSNSSAPIRTIQSFGDTLVGSTNSEIIISYDNGVSWTNIGALSEVNIINKPSSEYSSSFSGNLIGIEDKYYTYLNNGDVLETFNGTM